MTESQQVSSRQQYLWYGVLIVLFAVACFMLFRMIRLNSEIAEYHHINTGLVARVDSLIGQMRKISPREDSRAILLSAYDIARMKDAGLQHPVQDLIADLRGRTDLIPYKSTLGGEMRFYPEDIYILTSQWSLAYFEDGHIAGSLFLKYRVQQSGKIEWSVIEASRR